jgi:methyltransferase (TIGR00027 family)
LTDYGGTRGKAWDLSYDRTAKLYPDPKKKYHSHFGGFPWIPAVSRRRGNGLNSYLTSPCRNCTFFLSLTALRLISKKERIQMEEGPLSRRDFLKGALVSASAGLVSLSIPMDGFSQGLGPAAGDSAEKGTRMEDGRPSATAFNAALLRAVHQIWDNPKVFDDPLALKILGQEGETWVRSNIERFLKGHGMRAFIVLRSRYAEDELARAIDKGVRQYVILGAGLDTFAFRNSQPASRLHVYEVDHPATQSWKRRRLQEAGIEIPDSLTFAPVDFEKETLGDGLRQAGFKADEPAYFSLLGVVVYLTRAAATETFKYVASLPRGSEIVFDCSVPDASLSEYEKVYRDKRAERMSSIGEPWITYFDPPALANDLRQLGFTSVSEFGSQAANERYFKDRADGLRVAGSGRLVKARV